MPDGPSIAIDAAHRAPPCACPASSSRLAGPYHQRRGNILLYWNLTGVSVSLIKLSGRSCSLPEYGARQQYIIRPSYCRGYRFSSPASSHVYLGTPIDSAGAYRFQRFQVGPLREPNTRAKLAPIISNHMSSTLTTSFALIPSL